MELGILLADMPADLPSDEQLTCILRQVEAGQRAGFTYFFMGHHFIYGGYAWHQPVPMLARLAGETDEDVTLGTGVMLAPLYHPIVLAEEVATLDVVCEGRLVLGLGAGYRTVEFSALGVPFEERVGRLEESIDVLRLLWSDRPRISHRGRYWSFEDVTPHLRPHRTGGPPIWLGGKSRAAVRRAARLGDRWLATSKVPWDELRLRWSEYETERKGAGQVAATLPINRQIVPGPSRRDALDRHRLMTDARLDAYEARELQIDSPIVRETRDATQTAFLGTPREIIDDVTALVTDVPLDPIFVRTAWPGMSLSEIVGFIEELGRDVVPGLREIEVGPKSDASI